MKNIKIIKLTLLPFIIFLVIISILYLSNNLLEKSLNKIDYEFSMKKDFPIQFPDGLYMIWGIHLENFKPTPNEKEIINKKNLDIFINNNDEILYYYYGHPDDYLVAVNNGYIFKIVGRKYYFGGKIELIELNALMQTTAIDHISDDPFTILDEKQVKNIFNDDQYKKNRWLNNIIDRMF